jgi:hypothetical protein
MMQVGVMVGPERADTVRKAARMLTLGVGLSHHWIVTDMLGLKHRTREVLAGIAADFK